MTSEERDALVREYLLYLDWGRLPETMPTTREEAKAMTEAITLRAETNPHWDAWQMLDALIDDDPETAWDISLELLATCDPRDLHHLGAGPLEMLIWQQHELFADRFEESIANSIRFRDAFTYVRMGGVPLTTQRRLNAALVRTGIDPASLVEFDEEVPEP